MNHAGLVPSLAAASLILAVAPSCDARPSAATQSAERTLKGSKSFLDGYPAKAAGDKIHVVVEIPAGTNAKWEVAKADGSIRWEVKNGKPRVVQYLGYPANYGMVPRTLLPKELGGDGDPLDVLLLGPAQKRGAVVPARLIGVLRLLDGAEQDDKLIAVADGSPFEGIDGIAALDQKFRGVSSILETFMTNYKGPGKMQSKGFAEAAEARRILDASIAAFERAK